MDPDMKSTFSASVWGRYTAIFFLLLICVVAFTERRYMLHSIPPHTSYENLISFQVLERPFCHRVLVPIMAWFVVKITGLPVTWAFQLFEIAFAMGLIIVYYRLFNHFMPRRAAGVFAVAIYFILPYVFLLRYTWNFFYPWDTAAMFFLILGIVMIIENRWAALVATLIIGMLNRETAIILVPLAFVLLIDCMAPGKLVALLLVMIVTAVAVRFGVIGALPECVGESTQYISGSLYRLLVNVHNMVESRYYFKIFSSLAFLPIIWLLIRRDIPPRLARVKLVAWAFFLLLIFVGNLDEPRMFGELVVLLYVPIAVALYSRVAATAPPDLPRTELNPHRRLMSVTNFADRFGVFLIILGYFTGLVALFYFKPQGLGSRGWLTERIPPGFGFMLMAQLDALLDLLRNQPLK